MRQLELIEALHRAIDSRIESLFNRQVFQNAVTREKGRRCCEIGMGVVPPFALADHDGPTVDDPARGAHAAPAGASEGGDQ